jgi:assimilatory nitrate reductase catalytic subunit
MRLHEDGTLQAFVLAGDASAQAWVLDLLQQGQPAAAFGRALLAASRQPPQALPARSRQVCACHDVREDLILATLAQCSGDEAARLQTLQSQLKCGTSCGSCLPELKSLLRRSPQPEALA